MIKIYKIKYIKKRKIEYIKKVYMHIKNIYMCIKNNNENI